MPTPEIRRITYADLPQVVAIERRAFPSPWSLAMFVLELGKPGGVSIAAVEPGDRLLGYCICSHVYDVWHLMDLATDPDRRREGIGATLVQGLIERLPDGSQVTLEVRRSNRSAQRLYESFGFKAAGVRRRYYADNGEDAVIMWRTPGTLRGDLDDVPAADPGVGLR